METKKTNIVIVDYKDTSATRTTFETAEHGKMSAFKNDNSTLIQDLKDHINCLISVDVSKTEKEGTTYYNIRKLNGKVAGSSNNDVNIEDTMPKNNQFFKKAPEVTARKSVKGSAYEKDPVGLAVEVFNATLGTEIGQAMAGIDIMNESISIVKQAQKAFE